jgi:hypothetical protein
MKPTSLRFIVALCATATALGAAPLTETTPVYAKAEVSAPVIASLKAGTEAVLAPEAAPAGWTAVTLAGPHEVYASNKDVNKALEVRPGSPYLTEAKAGAPVFAIAEKGDKTDITDYRGKWTKFRLTKPVVGYIKTTAKIEAKAAPVASAPVKDAPTPAPAATIVPRGTAAPVGDGASGALPRLFQGKLASTYNPLRPRRPYDYQLNDDAGARYAYVDVSKLLATEQISKYIDRTVVVYGTAQAVPGTKDMVVVAESLQLR